MTYTSLSKPRLAAPGATALCSMLLAAGVAYADELDDFIVSNMTEGHIPGLSACVVEKTEVMFSKAYGKATFSPPIPATTDTLFTIGSISKTVTGTALMQLWEDGAFNLDDPVNDYLPFEVSHPVYADIPITFRMTLSHVSSIHDNDDVVNELLTLGGDSPIALGQFLEDYLTPGGEYYDPTGSYSDYKPGTNWEYSNIAFALNGYLVEVLAGMPFDQYCQQHIFDVLGMDETKWFLKDLDLDHLATGYYWQGGSYAVIPHHGHPMYPAGWLRTSSPQLAHFLIAHINGGQWQGATILDAETVELMQTPQYPDIAPWQGMPFLYGQLSSGDIIIGHSGQIAGGTALMYWRPEDGRGVITLTNGTLVEETELLCLAAILERLFEPLLLCPADITGDGLVDVLDLLKVLAGWGQSGVPADVNADGIVDVLDLLEILAAWGPCP